MAQCISPFYKKDTGMSFPCGKCYPCKQRRVSGWSFRLMEEAKRSDSALFLTLTYSNETVPLTKNGYMTLRKKDLQGFIKRLRVIFERRMQKKFGVTRQIFYKKYKQYFPPIKYYSCGEYGEKTKRPHYHLIIFNAEYQDIELAWSNGEIHYGYLSPASAAYTLKYISKDSMYHHSNDDRIKEFSLMSKKLGDNYLTPEKIKWHKQGKTERFCITIVGGKKIAIPRYYKQKIWNAPELQLLGAQIADQADKNYAGKTNQQKLAIDKNSEDFRKYYAHINKDTRTTSI